VLAVVFGLMVLSDVLWMYEFIKKKLCDCG
jgi:hypothetical protein